MFTLLAFNEDQNTANAYDNIAGAADQTTRVVNDVVYVPDKFNKILWVCARGRDVIKAKLESPSLRKMGVLDINPTENLDYAEYVIQPHARYTGASPLPLTTGEGLEAFTWSGRASDYYVAVGVCLGEGPVTPVTGEIWTIRATCASTTPVIKKWVNVEMTFDETLPVGRYQIVGAEVWLNRGLLFRFVPIGTLNRPGGLACWGHQQRAPDWQRWGAMGVWCEFHSSTPPSVDFLCEDTTDTTVSVHLDVIKIA